MLSLGGLVLTTPWLLAALAVLPLLFWLLRVTPPAPRQVRFPAIALLFGLSPREETPAKTPLWLILLRMALAALLIVALAHPLLNPAPTLGRGGPLVLVVDDGWAAGPRWPEREALMAALIEQAARQDRNVALLTTAAVPGEGEATPTLLRAADARGAVQALKPKPWPVDRAAAARRAARLTMSDANIVWLGDGIDGPGTVDLARELVRHGDVRLVSDDPLARAHLLLPAGADTSDMSVAVKRAASGAEQVLAVRASGEDGRLLARSILRFPPDARSADVKLPMPVELQNQAMRIDVEGEGSAGTTLLLDERWRRRPVGIAGAGAGIGAQTEQPLLSPTYYLERALQPFTEIRRAPVTDLLKQPLAMIVLPDTEPSAPAEREALSQWMASGGVLLRFAGPHLAEVSDDRLLPVTLRRGDRTLGGALSWAQPAHLAVFPAESPFAGLAVPPDVTVTRQVLAEPSLDLAAKTWARLTDGTPLVTAEKRGQGFLVLVHTTANNDWSNLALSGLFVDMLRRLVGIGAGVAGGASDAVLTPLQTLDGNGRLVAPPATAQPIRGAALAKTTVDGSHPPGFYGAGDARAALNLSQSVAAIEPMGPLPPGIAQASFAASREVDLRPWLLGAALAMALADLVIGYALRGLFAGILGRRAAARAAAGLVAALLACSGVEAQTSRPAQPAGPAISADDAKVVQATSELHLAFIHTGAAEVDRESRAGLTGLTAVLNGRTAVEAAEPLEVDPEQDDLVFFPLLYWPVTLEQPALSDRAIRNLNQFMATGGTILFDTRDADEQTFGAGDGAQRLRTLISGLEVPPLIPIPPEHVLTKAFYLLQEFPGRFQAATLWVEPPEARVNDGVSTVVIGASDWAGAWAVDDRQNPLHACTPGGERQREMAYRFGVNLVMYALTGNYKADQVHVPSILERLGQ